MKKICLAGLAALVLFGGAAHAKVVPNLDANTLWNEDGQNVETGPDSSADYWSGDLGIKSSAAGFVLTATDPKKYSSGRYMTVDAAYPWLVWEISDAQTAGEQNGYRAMTVSLIDTPPIAPINPVGDISKGIYTFKILRDLPNTTGVRWLRFDLYNSALTFSTIRMVKVPDNYIEVSSPSIAAKKRADKGDEITFTVNLRESAEDVSLTFFDSYTMPQIKLNGETKLQLKPKDDDQKVWSATVKLDSIEGDLLKAGEQFEPNRMFIKATVLGGAVKTPIWTGNPYQLHVKPDTK